MKRRDFLIGTGAIGAAAAFPVGLASAAPFTSDRISVKVEGSGPDVILIPGLTASRFVWSRLVADLPGYRYHLVEVQGFAGTKPGANLQGPLLTALVGEISRYISEAGLPRPAVIGHSMGGTLATMLAARHPASVGRVMVVDIQPQPSALIGSTAAAIAPIANQLQALFGSSPGGRALMTSFVSRFGARDPSAPKSDPDVVAKAAHELAILDLTPELGKIAAPLTVVYATPRAGGGVDPAAITRSYRNAYAGAVEARLRPIANSGHMVMLDQPAAFAAEVREFLN